MAQPGLARVSGPLRAAGAVARDPAIVARLDPGGAGFERRAVPVGGKATAAAGWSTSSGASR